MPPITRETATASKKAVTKIDSEVSAAVAALTDLDRKTVVERWQSALKDKAPGHLPTWLIRRILAYRIQAAAFGDLDRASVRVLDQIADDREQRKAAGEKLGKKPPRVQVAPPRRMKPGTILIREHNRHMHHVTATATGFLWNTKEYRSLTEVAFAITGTRWNGPRFFGLRSKRGQPEALQ